MEQDGLPWFSIDSRHLANQHTANHSDNGGGDALGAFKVDMSKQVRINVDLFVFARMRACVCVCACERERESARNTCRIGVGVR